MEVKEGNKLIAEFMGGKPCDRCKNCGLYLFEDGSEVFEKWLDYHKSWDRLMPVVEKITKQLPREEESNGYTQCSIKIDAWINSGYPYNLMVSCRIGDFYVDGKAKFYISKGGGTDTKDGSLIDSVYSAVIEFIKMVQKK